MHAFFHIRTVIIPRDRYRSEGYEVLCRLLFALLFFFIWALYYLSVDLQFLATH